MTPAEERAVLERAAKVADDFGLEVAAAIRSLPLTSKHSDAEPVAWRTKESKAQKLMEWFFSTNERYTKTHKEWKWEPLYLHPPQPCPKCTEFARQAIGLDHDNAGLRADLEAAEAKCVMMKEIEELRAVFRDAYEVWAGSEGIPKPVTAAEAYLLQLLTQMRDEVKRGLK